MHDLRAAGFSVEYPLTPAKSDKQFKRAQELTAAFTLRLDDGQAVRVRNLKTREEKLLTASDIAALAALLPSQPQS